MEHLSDFYIMKYIDMYFILYIFEFLKALVCTIPQTYDSIFIFLMGRCHMMISGSIQVCFFFFFFFFFFHLNF